MLSTLVTDYVARGPRSAAPGGAPPIAAGAGAYYFCTDTHEVLSWNGTSWVLALPASGVTAGSFTNANITVDAQGRVTAAASGAAGGISQLTGDVVAGPGSGSQAATLAASGVGAGSYTNPNLTIDGKGRITAAVSGLPTGSYILVSSLTAANSVSLAWTGLNADAYELQIENMVPVADTNTLFVQTGQGAGPTWNTGGNYGTAVIFGNSAGVVGSGNGEPGFQLTVLARLSNVAGRGYSGRLLIRGCSTSGRRQQAHWQGGHWDTNAGGVRTVAMGFGDWAGDTNPTTALRLILNSGNISSGRASLYRIVD